MCATRPQWVNSGIRVHLFNMAVEVAILTEPSPAHRTQMFLLTMHPEVLVITPSSVEIFATNLTDIRLFPSMKPLVFTEF